MNEIIAKGGEFVPEAYSKIGDCYFFPAQQIVEENAQLSVDDPKYVANDSKIKELYEKAKPNYEKAKELAADKKQLCLYMIDKTGKVLHTVTKTKK